VTGIKNVKKRFLHLCLKVSRKDIDGLTDGICFIDIARAFMSESERVIKRFLSISLASANGIKSASSRSINPAYCFNSR